MVSDNFVVLIGTWIPNQKRIMIISVYAPHDAYYKRVLWSYLEDLVKRWNGECIIMGDFNEVRRMEERWGTNFNSRGAHVFNNFISNAGLVDIQLEGYSFTWAHPSGKKMSKLDRFLVADGLLTLFPHMSAVCLERHLSDQRPILLREVIADYEATPFQLYHSWFSYQDSTWESFNLNDSNDMIQFKKKLQILKTHIRLFVADQKKNRIGRVNELKSKLSDIDSLVDLVGANDDVISARTEYMSLLLDIKDDEAAELENPITCDEIRNAVWGCDENKSPGPNGYTFEFFILDGPFIINELLARCHHKKQSAMVFKVDFAKAYDSIRWDYLKDVLLSFGFGVKWCKWIRRCLMSSMASILVNGSPTSEFQFHCGLKQGDPLAPLDSSTVISHLFYADDAIFIGDWSQNNLKGILYSLHCFSLLSGLSINVKKSQLLGVGIPPSKVNEAATLLGCSVMKAPFKYLGVYVGIERYASWDLDNSTWGGWGEVIGTVPVG
nr:hypothetical protein [Tanacetum cinerariifolium]